MVTEGSWDVGSMDTVVEKLMHVSNIVVGGRAAISPLYEARRLTSRHWVNPQGKPPQGARVIVSSGPQSVNGELQMCCVNGLHFWLQHLSNGMPRHCRHVGACLCLKINP
jgi:hypothetical protein